MTRAGDIDEATLARLDVLCAQRGQGIHSPVGDAAILDALPRLIAALRAAKLRAEAAGAESAMLRTENDDLIRWKGREDRTIEGIEAERDAARAVVAELVAALRNACRCLRCHGTGKTRLFSGKDKPCNECGGDGINPRMTNARAALARAAALLDGKGEG